MTQHPVLRPLLASLFAAVLVVGMAGCGDDEDEPTETGAGDGGDTGGTTDDAYGGSTTGGGADAAKGTIVAIDYELSDITVGPGESIVLKNEGDDKHTATADGGEFDLGEVEPGDTSEPDTAPEEPGEYAFHCEIHDSMTATLTVEG